MVDLIANDSLALTLIKIHFMKRIITIAFVLFTVAAQAQMKAEDVKTFTLKNGMKFLVIEDNSIPNANMYLFYNSI